MEIGKVGSVAFREGWMGFGIMLVYSTRQCRLNEFRNLTKCTVVLENLFTDLNSQHFPPQPNPLNLTSSPAAAPNPMDSPPANP
jgi:hypothetical protein